MKKRKTRKSKMQYKCKTYTKQYILFSYIRSKYLKQHTWVPMEGGWAQESETQRTKTYMTVTLHHFTSV